MKQSFIHLRVHSEFSLVNGLVRVKPLIKDVLAKGMPAVAITDQTNLFALVKFYKAAIQNGVKPIVGSDFLLENEVNFSQPFRFTLLVQNKDGYANLIRLISRAYLEGQQQGIPYVKKEWLKEEGVCDGLIALSGGRSGDIGQALLNDAPELVSALVPEWSALFPDRFYLELHRTGRENEEQYLHRIITIAEQNGLPVVATNDVCFLSQDDFEAHEARVCIHDSRTLDDPRRAHLYSEHQYLKSPDEMIELFKDIPEAIENTVEIAKRCNLEIELDINYLPNYPVPEGLTIEDYFQKLSLAGLEKRLLKTLDSNSPELAEKERAYKDRLKFELDIINQMGFPGYFLIVMDFIRWAKQNDVPVGPGRGSGAGSLVAYALEITDIDPIQYDLLFERFLNPERVSMPDFDIDFCMEGRDRVIEYVAETYGREAVSQIITFGTMAAKGVVRDVARVQGKPYGLADKLSKMIPFEVGMTLSKAVEQEEQLRDFIEQNEEVAEIMDMAYKLEGVARNVGKHAGGVVIAPTRLTDFSPLYCDDAGNNLVTQFDKNDVEHVGLVKFDFLGLRTLTIIDWAVKTINKVKQAKGEQLVDITEIPLDKKEVFELLQKGLTTAIFQLESRGLKELIQRLLPNSFEDVTALVALYRPGPLQSGMVDDFISRKHGRSEVQYSHPALEPILENTYGVILYQEQVMKIAQVLANYTLGQADVLRRAMGKKKPEEMAKQRKIFLEGAKNNGIAEDKAGFIFDLMEKFAGYGFNKSHSAAYAMLSYQTAWLKAYYPAPFMAAVLSADMQNTDKVVILIEDCRTMSLSLVLPNVNIGEYKFTVDESNQVVYGLGAIKGLGEGPIESIVQAREKDGRFTDLFDFCTRVDLRKVNRRAIEALIRSGAMDELAPHRAILMACLEEAIKTAEQHAQNRHAGMVDLFGGMAGNGKVEQVENVYKDYLNTRQWTERHRLHAEKETLGLYLRGHPIDEYERELKQITPIKIASLQTGKKSQLFAGLIVDIRTMRSKRGDNIAFVTLDDRTSRIEVAVFTEAYNAYRDLLMKDTILVVEGEVSTDDYSGAIKARANKMYDIEKARIRFAKELLLRFDAANERHNMDLLLPLLKPYRAEGCRLVVEYTNEFAKGRVHLSESWQVRPHDDLLFGLKEKLGKKCVRLRYK